MSWIPKLAIYLWTVLNQELILRGSRSLADPVKVNGAGHLGRLFPSGGTDMVSGSGGGLGGGEGEGSLLGCLDSSGSSGSCSGSGFGAPSWWSCSSAVSSSSSPSSSSSSSSSELSSSSLWWLLPWLSIGGSWTGSWAGFLEGSLAGGLACTFAWSLAGAFCFAADEDGPAGALVKCPLLSPGSEMVASLGEQVSPGVCSRPFKETRRGTGTVGSRRAKGDQSYAKDQGVLKSGSKNVTSA